MKHCNQLLLASLALIFVGACQPTEEVNLQEDASMKDASWEAIVNFSVTFPNETQPAYQTWTEEESNIDFSRFLEDRYNESLSGRLAASKPGENGAEESILKPAELKALIKQQNTNGFSWQQAQMTLRQHWAIHPAQKSIAIHTTRGAVSATKDAESLMAFSFATEVATSPNWEIDLQLATDQDGKLLVQGLLEREATTQEPLRAMAKELFKQAQNGQIKGFKEENLQQALTENQLESYLNSKDTVYTENAETGTMVPVVIGMALLEKDLAGLQFKQRWSYDPAQDQLTVEVEAVRFLVEFRDLITGEMKGYKPLFWLPLE